MRHVEKRPAMCLSQSRDFRPLLLQVLTGCLALAAGASSQARQYGYPGTGNYQWGVGYGANYNYGYYRYGQGGFAGSPYNPTAQSQLNLGMTPAGYDIYRPPIGAVGQGASTNDLAGAAQAMQNQRQMQVMEPRFDVRKRTPRTLQAKSKQANKPLTRDQVLSPDGKVLWPTKAPGDGELGKSRAAAEAAIKTAYKEFNADGKASVQNLVEAKERLYAYGHPALEKAGRQNLAAAHSLHHFLFSLEQVLDSLGGV
jgi:hypothetical protein